MKTIRKEFPIIRVLDNGYYRIECRQKWWTEGGGQPTYSRSTKEEAFAKAREIAELKAQYGKSGVFHDKDKQVYRELITRLIPFNITLSDVVNDWITNRSSIVTGSSKTVVELANKWMKDKSDKSNKDINPLASINPLADKTMDQIQYTVSQLESFFPTEKISEIDKAKIEYVYSVWKKQGVSLNTISRNYGKMFKSFFRWCVKQNYIKINPCENVVVGREETIKLKYAIDEVETIFHRLKTEPKNMRLTPHYVLLLLVGIRPEATELLTWDHINFKTNQIEVPADFVKTGITHYPVMHPNVAEWLKPWIGKPLYIEKNIRKRRESIQRGLTQQQNICRHTAISFWVHKYEGKKEQVALWMNNSVATINKHYLQGVPKEDVERFFNLVPNYTDAEIELIKNT